MKDIKKRFSDHSIHIGGNARGNVIQTGDNNTTAFTYQTVSLPPAESVDIRNELAALKTILTELETPERKKIVNAFSDAEAELEKAEPDKSEIGKALERALDYGGKLEKFSSLSNKLKPHVVNAAGWLGEYGAKLLAAIGLQGG